MKFFVKNPRFEKKKLKEIIVKEKQRHETYKVS